MQLLACYEVMLIGKVTTINIGKVSLPAEEKFSSGADNILVLIHKCVLVPYYNLYVNAWIYTA
jgi:hypothetical protein